MKAHEFAQKNFQKLQNKLSKAKMLLEMHWRDKIQDFVRKTIIKAYYRNAQKNYYKKGYVVGQYYSVCFWTSITDYRGLSYDPMFS